MSNEPALAMCWYDEAQWHILKALDPDALDDSYEAWRKNATRALHEMSQTDHKIGKVSIKIDAFLKWCEDCGVEPNAQSRSTYAAWKFLHRGN